MTDLRMDAAVATFVEEATELLQQLEDSLLQVPHHAPDEETINGLFRAVHTIKGSAGLFGFDAAVEFTPWWKA